MSLRSAGPADLPALLAAANREPFFNLFLIANLRAGLGADMAAWTGSGGVLARRGANWMLDAGPDPAAFDFVAAAAVVDGHPPEQVRGLTGQPEAVEPLLAALQRHSGRLYCQFFAVLERPPVPIAYSGVPRPATAGDLEALANLYAVAGDMSRSREQVERMLPTLWVVEEGGVITSAANVAARTDRAAMIGAVYTPLRFRGRGHASTVVHAVSAAELAAGRTPCLFYHNPAAGRIYQRLGYRETGPFRMVRFGTRQRL